MKKSVDTDFDFIENVQLYDNVQLHVLNFHLFYDLFILFSRFAKKPFHKNLSFPHETSTIR